MTRDHLNQTPGRRLICEWCGRFLPLKGRSQKQRFCSRKGCQNPYLSSNKTSEQIRKTAESNTGQVRSDEQKAKMSQSQMGHECNEETRAKMSKSHLGKDPWNKGLSTGPLSQDHRDRISSSNKKAYIDYQYNPDAPQPQYRRRAIEAYGHECSGCGCTDKCMDVHHLNGNHSDDRLDNLVVLCKSCHARIHCRSFGRDTDCIDEEFTRYVIESRNSKSKESELNG